MNNSVFISGNATNSGRLRKATTGLLISALAAITLGGLVSPAQADALTVPDAPSITLLGSGSNQLTVNFTAPSWNGGAEITNYEYVLDSGSWVTPSPAVTASPLVITGLTNETNYAVKLRAVNSAGSGSQSNSEYATASILSFTTDGNGNATITGCHGGVCPKNLVFPDFLSQYSRPKVIVADAFNGKGLESVTLNPDMVTVGDRAFKNNSLTTFNSSQSVTTIGAEAYSDNALTSATFVNNSLTSIGASAFKNNALTSVVFSGIPNPPTDGGTVFAGNPNLTSVKIYYYMKANWSDKWSGIPIEVRLFRYETDVDNNVKITGLDGCPSDMVIPDSLGGNPVTSIKTWFLANAECSPKSITVPASVTTIGTGAFSYSTFTSVTFLGNAPTEVAGAFSFSTASFIDVPYGATGYGATWSGIPVRYGAAPVVAKSPVYVSGAKIAGSHKVGSKLTATAGSWTSATAKTKTFAWYVCSAKVSAMSKTGKVAKGCKAIAKATKSTYVLKAADKSKFIAAKITVKNTKGSSSIFTKTIGAVNTW